MLGGTAVGGWVGVAAVLPCRGTDRSNQPLLGTLPGAVNVGGAAAATDRAGAGVPGAIGMAGATGAVAGESAERDGHAGRGVRRAPGDRVADVANRGHDRAGGTGAAGYRHQAERADREHRAARGGHPQPRHRRRAGGRRGRPGAMVPRTRRLAACIGVSLTPQQRVGRYSGALGRRAPDSRPRCGTGRDAGPPEQAGQRENSRAGCDGRRSRAAQSKSRAQRGHNGHLNVPSGELYSKLTERNRRLSL